MQIRNVVTAFLAHPSDGTVLLGKRSSSVSTYPGHWAAISGSIENVSAQEQALKEIREETGLDESDVKLLAEGWPVRFPDWQLNVFWIANPFLFRCAEPDKVRKDWEHLEFRWISPDKLGSLKTVPKLKEAYDAAGEALQAGGRHTCDQIFRMVEQDREHGDEELGIWTLMGLKASLEESASACRTPLEPLQRLRDACRRAGALRPSMAPPLSASLEAFRIGRNLLEGSRGDLKETSAQVSDELQHTIETRRRAALECPRALAEFMDDEMHLVTISRSFTVLCALRQCAGKVASLTVAESRPACEGRETARTAASFGIATKLLSDGAAAHAVAGADAVVVGADALCGDGAAVNKTGTFALCCAAAHFAKPVLVACTQSKIMPAGLEPAMENMPPSELGGPITGVEICNTYFEKTPAQLITHIITENGILSRRALREAAADLKGLRDDLMQES